MKKYLFLLLLLAFNLHAQDLCQRLLSDVSIYLENSSSRIGFKNGGGLMNGGVCWWHSRLQRASTYLADFHPAEAAPTHSQVKDILLKLKQMKQVVRIPGFSDFHTFTTTYRKDVQKLLEDWQKEDGFLNQQWVRGISGRSELSVSQMKERMDKVYAEFLASPKPLWIMAQIKGIESHAFLVYEMLPSADGYELRVVDSNFPLENKVIHYVFGQKFLKHSKDKYSFVPYSGFQKDFMAIGRSVKEFCGIEVGH